MFSFEVKNRMGINADFTLRLSPLVKNLELYLIWFVACVCVFLPWILLGGESGGTGNVRGTITIGGRPTSDVVVSVEGLSPKQLNSQLLSGKFDKAVMDQRDVKFIPRVLAIRVGSTVDFLNSDKTFHNVFSTSEAKRFDLGLYSPGRSRAVTFEKPGVVRILCHVHPHMEAFIVVKEHAFFGVTDKHGSYQLGNVPLGKYRLELWHPEFGTRVETFYLARDGEVLTIDADLKRK
jgi:plastocyanin